MEKNLTIVPAYSHPEEVQILFSEYTQMLISGDSTFREYLNIQHYDEEIKHLEVKYGMPDGRLYLAYLCAEPSDEPAVESCAESGCESTVGTAAESCSDSGCELAGCIGLRKIDDQNCEMKRLYVRPQFRGNKIGDRLVSLIISDAKKIGYSHMLLDTLPFLKSALRLYEQHGFYEIESYNDSPMENSIYMKLDL